MRNAFERSFSALHPLLLVALTACGSEDAASNTAPDEGGQEMALTAGIHVSDAEAVFRTEEYVLEPGTERYLCYAATVDRDLVVDGYRHDGAATLHHVQFSRTLAPEPEGMSECDVLFRYTWEPMYLAGAGASKLEFPANTAHRIAKGTQLLAQLHLFNATDEPQKGRLEVKMHRSTAVDPAAVNVYLFGNFEVQVPPLQKSTVEATCKVPEEVNLIAAFPHMHKLGTELTFDVGPSESQMTRAYQRSPYSFDDQRLEPFNLKLSAGDVTHVSCRYENPYDQTITFGESTMNEMCFLIGFAVRPQIGGCFLGLPPLLP